AQQNSIEFNINTQNPTTGNIPENSTNYAYDYFPLKYEGTLNNVQGNQITLTYKPNITTNPNGTFYFDYLEVQYKENLSFNGSQMNFRDFSLVSGSNTSYGFSINNASNVEQV